MRLIRSTLSVAVAFSVAATVLFAAGDAEAIPAFSRRYEVSCSTCHQFHYPRLNSYGRRFRENGYQLPRGAEDQARARRTIEPGTPNERLSVFKESPLSFRGEVFGVFRPSTDDSTTPKFDNKIFAFILGGGSIAKDVSYFFAWTPFPESDLHQARVGLHNIAEKTLGSGSLNVRAGAMFVLDFQRPGHRFLSTGPTSATSVSVGQNRFSFDNTNLGVQVYGRPKWGPVFYEVSLLSGDPGDVEGGTERDQWKDIFARATYTFFYNSANELRLGGFGYRGRSDIVSESGGVTLAQRDDFYMVGGDLEFDLGPFNLFGMGYIGHHSDAYLDGRDLTFYAGRLEGILSLSPRWTTSLRFEYVYSKDDTSLKQTQLAPHLTYQFASNVLGSLVWRHNVRHADESSGLFVLDAAF